MGLSFPKSTISNSRNVWVRNTRDLQAGFSIAPAFWSILTRGRLLVSTAMSSANTPSLFGLQETRVDKGERKSKSQIRSFSSFPMHTHRSPLREWRRPRTSTAISGCTNDWGKEETRGTLRATPVTLDFMWIMQIVLADAWSSLLDALCKQRTRDIPDLSTLCEHLYQLH